MGRPIGRGLGRSSGRFPTARKPGPLCGWGAGQAGTVLASRRGRAPGAPSAGGGSVSPRCSKAALLLLLVGNAGRPGLCQDQVLETVCLPRSSPRVARGCRGRSSHTKRSSGASAWLHPRTRADEEGAQQGMPCGLRPAPLAATAALHRLPPSFPLTSWRALRFPGPRRPGAGKRRQRVLRAGKGVGRRQDVLPAGLSDRSQGLHSMRLHLLIGKAKPLVRGQQDFCQMREAPQPRCAGGAPRNEALITQVHEHTGTSKRKDSNAIH